MRLLNRRNTGPALRLIVVAASLATGSLAGSEVDGSNDHALQTAFREAPLVYRLNRNIHNFPLDRAGQEALIHETLGAGWGGFALNVPFREYLTDVGMKATRAFCERAKANGMELWLYDEHGYPSGNAGDRVIKENPAWECMGIFFIHADISGGESTIEMPPGKVIQLVAFPMAEGKPDFTEPTDLLPRLEGSTLVWNAPAGDWKVFAASKDVLYEGFQACVKSPGGKLGARYPSLMIPEVTEAFLRSTHDKYAEHLGDDLGKYFKSTFTDEPSLMALQFHRYKYKHGLIPWHEIVSATIAGRHGYRPEDRLVEFYFDEGPAGQQVRYEYFKAIGDLFSENFFGAISNWCEKHGFASGGHLLLEESMVAHVPLYGNIMQCFRAMHGPGIDILSCLPDEMPVHSPKLASSAAELAGNTLVMSEPCPVADRRYPGGETPASSVRGHLNMLLQGGITDFNCYLRLKNFDRAGQNEINKYVARINLLLQGGHTVADVGLVYPIESLWTKYTPRYHRVSGWKAVSGASDAVNVVDQAFQGVSRMLFERRWEYLHLDSQAVADGRVQDGILVHDALRFKVIILPIVNTLSAEAWERLLEFVKQGGKLVAIGDMPLNSESKFPDAAVRDAFADLFASRENAVFMAEWEPDALDKLLNTWFDKPVKLADESQPVRIAHKAVNGRDVFFVMNDSDKAVRAQVTFRTAGPLEEWDPATGEVRPAPAGGNLELGVYHGKVYRSVKK